MLATAAIESGQPGALATLDDRRQLVTQALTKDPSNTTGKALMRLIDSKLEASRNRNAASRVSDIWSSGTSFGIAATNVMATP